jgi:hypothetical protein
MNAHLNVTSAPKVSSPREILSVTKPVHICKLNFSLSVLPGQFAYSFLGRLQIQLSAI